MSKRPVNLLLDDICQAIGRIEEYTTGMSFDAFSRDQKSVDAVARNFEIIGEAANRLSDDFKISHPSVEWHKIIGLRHRIIHEYFGVDIAIVWQIIQKDLPSLRHALSKIHDN